MWVSTFCSIRKQKNNIPLCVANGIEQPGEEKAARIVKKHKFLFLFYKKQQKLRDNIA